MTAQSSSAVLKYNRAHVLLLRITPPQVLKREPMPQVDDILELNVGGRAFVTHRSTLLQAPDSRLREMFLKVRLYGVYGLLLRVGDKAAAGCSLDRFDARAVTRCNRVLRQQCNTATL